MLRFLRLIVLAVVGVWSAIRGGEEAFAAWVRHNAGRDVTGLTWA
jgi:hypothetical protein